MRVNGLYDMLCAGIAFSFFMTMTSSTDKRMDGECKKKKLISYISYNSFNASVPVLNECLNLLEKVFSVVGHTFKDFVSLVLVLNP